MLIGFLALVLLLILKIGIAQTDVCSGQQWYHGWLPDHSVTYTVIEYSTSADYFVVGGYTTAISKFYRSS